MEQEYVRKKINPAIRYSLIIVVIVIILSILLTFKYEKEIEINTDELEISYSNSLNENNEYSVKANYKTLTNSMCSLDNVSWVPMNQCSFNLPVGEYTLYIKVDDVVASKDFNVISSIIGEFSSSMDNIPIYYLAVGGTKNINFKFEYDDQFDRTVQYTIEDPSIISIENDKIYGLKNGVTSFTARLKDGNIKKYTVQVTDIIQPASPNNNKEYLPCERYSEEEAQLLETILDSRIQEAGIGTRGAVLAAARFLSMEFPYSIRYFNENGRLNGHGRPMIDGEGRYYHKGLYLTKSDYKDISKSTATGPKVWGCNIYDQFISKMNMNGFTCSGFVTWAMLNGGFDVGDVGAGDFAQFNDDLSDLGPHHEITTEYMTNGNFKPGDFIGRNGHAALIIGVDENNVYTAESLPAKMKVYTYERYHGIVKDDNLTYVIEMSDIYPNGDGNWTWMWEH